MNKIFFFENKGPFPFKKIVEVGGGKYEFKKDISIKIMNISDLYMAKKNEISFLGLLIVILTGSLLIYGLQDIPAFGSPENPVQTYLADRYIIGSEKEIGIPNLVTSVLASYRGYDTLGEVTVIFTACIGVLMLLGRSRGDYKGIVSREKS